MKQARRLTILACIFFGISITALLISIFTHFHTYAFYPICFISALIGMNVLRGAGQARRDSRRENAELEREYFN